MYNLFFKITKIAKTKLQNFSKSQKSLKPNSNFFPNCTCLIVNAEQKLQKLGHFINEDILENFIKWSSFLELPPCTDVDETEPVYVVKRRFTVPKLLLPEMQANAIVDFRYSKNFDSNINRSGMISSNFDIISTIFE